MFVNNCKFMTINNNKNKCFFGRFLFFCLFCSYEFERFFILMSLFVFIFRKKFGKYSKYCAIEHMSIIME